MFLLGPAEIQTWLSTFMEQCNQSTSAEPRHIHGLYGGYIGNPYLLCCQNLRAVPNPPKKSSRRCWILLHHPNVPLLLLNLQWCTFPSRVKVQVQRDEQENQVKAKSSPTFSARMKPPCMASLRKRLAEASITLFFHVDHHTWRCPGPLYVIYALQLSDNWTVR